MHVPLQTCKLIGMEYSASGERIMDVATRLFYDDGIGVVGVDRVTAESGVSKPTLYAQFGSKAGLVAAVLQRRLDSWQHSVDGHLEKHNSSSQVLALFDWFAARYTQPGFRGCPFINAAAELPDPNHPGRAVIASYKSWIRQLLAELAESDGLSNPRRWGTTLMLLIDGANTHAMTTGDLDAMRDARAIAADLITASHTPQTQGTKP